MSRWGGDVLKEIGRFVFGIGKDETDEPSSCSRGGLDKGWLEDELQLPQHVLSIPTCSMRRRDVQKTYSVEVRTRLQRYYQSLASNEDCREDGCYSPHVDRLCDRSRSSFLAIGRMRATCKTWRCGVEYDLDKVYVHARWATKCRSAHLIRCRSLVVSGMRDHSHYSSSNSRRCPRQPPEMLRNLPELRTLSFHSMTLETLPWWFRKLRVRDLQFEDEAADDNAPRLRLSQAEERGGKASSSSSARRNRKRQRKETTLSRWLSSSSPSSHGCLPASLIEVDFRGISHQFSRVPLCLRSLSMLRDLWLGHAFNKVGVVPSWFEELSHLRRVSIGLSVDVFAPVLRNMSLKALSIDFTEFELDSFSDYERLDGCLDLLFSGEAPSKCALSLTELNLCWWWEALSEFPPAIKNCRNLEALNVGNSTITDLPDWLCDQNFPRLALLDLAASDLLAFPLHLLLALSSLRVLIVDDKISEEHVDAFRRARPQLELRMFYV